MARRRKKRRSRRRSPKKKRTYRRRTASRGKKRKTRGIAGRVGALMLGVLPPAIAGIEAVSNTMGGKAKNYNAASKVLHGICRFCNNISMGFMGKEAFGQMEMTDASGGTSKQSVGSGIPAGSLWGVTLPGVIMLGYDWVASQLAGGQVNIPGTHYAATGSR